MNFFYAIKFFSSKICNLFYRDNEEMVSSDESDDDDITDGTNTHDLMSKAEVRTNQTINLTHMIS